MANVSGMVATQVTTCPRGPGMAIVGVYTCLRAAFVPGCEGLPSLDSDDSMDYLYQIVVLFFRGMAAAELQTGPRAQECDAAAAWQSSWTIHRFIDCLFFSPCLVPLYFC